MTKIRHSFVVAVLCAAVAAGCSDGDSRQTLTAPSPTMENALTSPALTADRTTSSRAATAGETAVWASSHGWETAADGIVVEATETITAVSGSCPTKTITIRGVPVALTSATTYTAPITCASLAVNDTVEVTALLTFTASGFTVTATNVAPDDDDGDDDDGDDDDDDNEPGTGGGKKARGEGVIGSITGSCPTLTLVITGTRVSTTATTEYVNGSCETLREGTKVKIDGELKPGGTAVAEKIEIERTPGRPVSGDGRVEAVTGTCPAVTLTVHGVKVVTSNSTTFTGGLCGDIGVGSHIDVTGTYDGTALTATAVHIRKP